jgi:hypothetical protein
MSIDALQAPRKSQSTQPTNGNGNQPSKSNFDKFRVSRKLDTRTVRLKHSFIVRWARVLHPFSFVVFTVLEMYADWNETVTSPNPAAGNGVYPTKPLEVANPNYGHTKGWTGLKRIAELTGCNRSHVHRALVELEQYGLLSHADPDPAARSRNGTETDWIISQDVDPPSEVISLTYKGLEELSARRHSGGTRLTSETPPVSPVRPPPSHPWDGSRLTSETPPVSPVRPPSTSSVPSVSSVPLESSSSSASGTEPNPTTTTCRQTPPTIERLRQVLRLSVDDGVLWQLWLSSSKEQPSITLDELKHFVDIKLDLAMRGHVVNPPGFLLAAVPAALRGRSLGDYRAAVARRADELSRGGGDSATELTDEQRRLIQLDRAQRTMRAMHEYRALKPHEQNESERLLAEFSRSMDQVTLEQVSEEINRILISRAGNGSTPAA